MGVQPLAPKYKMAALRTPGAFHPLLPLLNVQPPNGQVCSSLRHNENDSSGCFSDFEFSEGDSASGYDTSVPTRVTYRAGGKEDPQHDSKLEKQQNIKKFILN